MVKASVCLAAQYTISGGHAGRDSLPSKGPRRVFGHQPMQAWNIDSDNNSDETALIYVATHRDWVPKCLSLFIIRISIDI